MIAVRWLREHRREHREARERVRVQPLIEPGRDRGERVVRDERDHEHARRARRLPRRWRFAADGTWPAQQPVPVDEHGVQRQPMQVPQIDDEPERDRLDDKEQPARRAHDRPLDEHARKDRRRLRYEVEDRGGLVLPRIVDDPLDHARPREPGEIEAHEQLVAEIVRQRPAQREVAVHELVKCGAREHQRDRELHEAQRPLVAAHAIVRRQRAQLAHEPVDR